MVEVIAKNKKAYFEYQLLEKFEAGIELKGSEVKSIRQGKVSLKESFCLIKEAEIYVYGMHISPYEKSGNSKLDPIRARKLLLHKGEADKLYSITAQKGFALIPVSIYFKKGFAKLEIAVAKGKKIFDKRDKLREKALTRDIQRSLKK